MRAQRTVLAASSLVAAAVLSSCEAERPAAPAAGRRVPVSPQADAGPTGPGADDDSVTIQRAGNGAVTARSFANGRLDVTIADRDGIAYVQIVRTGAAGAAVDTSFFGRCERTIRVTVVPPPPHNLHGHRVIYSDCQARPASRDRAADSSSTEVWDIDQDPESVLPVRVRQQKDVNPRVVDLAPGMKRFRALLVSPANVPPIATLADCLPTTQALQAALRQYPNWPANSITLLAGAAATRAAVAAAIAAAQAASQPGDEFFFYYCDHGIKSNVDTAPIDEPIVGDNLIYLAPAPPAPRDRPRNDPLLDDELATMLSGFRASVTLTVVLEACFTGGFVDGTADLLSIVARPPAAATPLDKDHLAIMMTAGRDQCSFRDFSRRLIVGLTRNPLNGTTAADFNQDGVTTAQELFGYASVGTLANPLRSTPVFARGVGP